MRRNEIFIPSQEFFTPHGSGMGFHIRTEGSPKSPNPRNRIESHIKERNSPEFYRMVGNINAEFSNDNGPQKKSELIIAGLPKVAKTSLSEGLFDEFPVNILFTDFPTSILIARANGMVTSSLGFINIPEYDRIAIVDNAMVDLFFALDGRFLLLRETTLLTENIDINGKPIGVKRGSLSGIKGTIEKGYSVHVEFLSAAERFRRQNVAMWEFLRLMSQSEIIDAQKRMSLWDDTANPKRIHEKYQLANTKASDQNIVRLALNALKIQEQYERQGLDYESTLYRVHREKLAEEVSNDPELIDRLRELAIPRIIKYLYGDEKHPHAGELFNSEPLRPGIKRSVSRTLHEKYSLRNEISRQAKHGNQDIRRILRRLKGNHSLTI